MRIAVTGGSGRLGRHVVQALAPHAPCIIDIVPHAMAPPQRIAGRI